MEVSRHRRARWKEGASVITKRADTSPKTYLTKCEVPVEKSELDYIEEIDRKKELIAKRKQDERYTSERILEALEAAPTREDKVEILRRAIQYVPWNQLQYACRNATRGRR